MVAIQDKISIPDLIDFDGWDADHIVDSRSNPSPSFLIRLPFGKKTAGEILVTRDAANDLIQRYFLGPVFNCFACGMELLFDLFEWKEGGAFSSEAGEKLLHYGLLPGVMKIAECQFVAGVGWFCHVSQRIQSMLTFNGQDNDI